MNIKEEALVNELRERKEILNRDLVTIHAKLDEINAIIDLIREDKL
jgi:hypothetical protein